MADSGTITGVINGKEEKMPQSRIEYLLLKLLEIEEKQSSQSEYENQYFCDSIVNLPTDTENYPAGTLILTIDEFKIFALNSKKEWRDTDGKKASDIMEERGLEPVPGEIYPNSKDIKDCYCDTADDLPKDTSVLPIGTVYYAIDEGTFYILNSKKEWVSH